MINLALTEQGRGDIAEEINHLHDELCNMVKTSVEKAIQIGQLLTKQKDECERGSWIPWLEANVNFSRFTAARYMSCYRHRDRCVAGDTFDSIEEFARISELPELPNREESRAGGIAPSSKPNKQSVETREARVARHRRRVELNGLPEVLAALDSDEIAPAMAETISNLPKEYQLAKLEKEKQRYVKKKKNPTCAPQPKKPALEHRTGQAAKPEAQIPSHLLRGILTGDALVRGHAVSSDLEGQPCHLPIGVSKLERDECVATMIGGSRAFKDRKAYTKWETYHREDIRQKVLRALEQMSTLEIPEDFRLPPVTYEYNLGIACDLQELADMLYADLSRMAETLEIKEKYGHLFS